MPDFANSTPYGAFAIPSCDRDGKDVLLVVAAARFTIPPPRSADMSLSEKQLPPPREDVYWGEPGQSSLRIEGQSSYVRRNTDIYITGHACAPPGRTVAQMDVSIEVGPCQVKFRVSGDRRWERSLGRGAGVSAPEPFSRMPLVWERAFGGVADASTPQKPVFEPRNPVGCGLQVNGKDAIGKQLPNIEDPRHLVERPGDRAVPIGVGPISRAWQPRASYAGTYDEAWRRRRAPVWPEDFDDRFFSAAPEWLQARPHLRGGEAVALRGMHPEGPISFRLPALRLASRSRFLNGREVRTSLGLDGVSIDVDASELTLYYRASVEAPLSLVKHRETLLRQLDPWEVPA